jgi:predicted Zn-dependent peptidase
VVAAATAATATTAAVATATVARAAVVAADGLIRLDELGDGARVVTERLPGSRSVTAGFWVGVGARDESEPEAGASHFLEHLLFKGSDTRGAVEIARAVDAVGGEMNAFTAQEHTAYYVRLPAGSLELGLDLLSDVVWSPAIRADEVDAERRVILEELAMEEDTPDDRVMVLLGEAMFPGHELGREVLGSRATIGAMRRDDVAGFHDRWYRPANVVVAVAGDVEHDEVVASVSARVAADAGGSAPARQAPDQPPVPLVTLARPVEQAHLAVGWRALARHDADRFPLAALNHMLGGGMSSRLFQTIREERGLAYAVHSYPVAYGDAGALVVYAGTAPGALGEVLGLVEQEVARMVADGPTADELDVAVGYLVGSTLLGLEDSGGCMSRIGKAVLHHGRVMSVDELLDRFRAITLDDVVRVARVVLDDERRSVAVVGPRRALPGRGTPSGRTVRASSSSSG